MNRSASQFGWNREHRPAVVRAWPNLLGNGTDVTIEVGPAALHLTLPDATFATTRFRRVGGIDGAPRAEVHWGDVPASQPWALVADDASSRLVGDGFAWSADRRHLTLSASLRPSPGLAYGALIDGAMSWHVERVLEAGGVLLHAACFGHAGDATVVVGQSHAGKSTLAKRLEPWFLSEEYGFVVPGAEGWQLWWFGERRAPCAERPSVWPLARVLCLGPDRARTAVEPMAVAEGLATLWPCVMAPDGAHDRVLANLVNLVGAVPMGKLAHCLESPESEVTAVVLGGHP